uniref:Uncharacterized protein n=1 Tax=Chromera velia CCMP2878 TaxID=1169474 RepID=A0A0G4HZD2_9ALVE|eukprot:Cvel_9686.t1-p1 / transcript=Cvel_9686.t1 / gene=Cvel_9686 / organism=Chromera_velia_CCMP2878 / gene_product=hypothetical protein / transcript_product=hypothetical protein / location=Cvel_scaffold564:41379-42736(+) / protein_length=166 / sequence_SO=supercontig / SO=protein_coding / is_pseudo=false
MGVKLSNSQLDDDLREFYGGFTVGKGKRKGLLVSDYSSGMGKDFFESPPTVGEGIGLAVLQTPKTLKAVPFELQKDGRMTQRDIDPTASFSEDLQELATSGFEGGELSALPPPSALLGFPLPPPASLPAPHPFSAAAAATAAGPATNPPIAATAITEVSKHSGSKH